MVNPSRLTVRRGGRLGLAAATALALLATAAPATQAGEDRDKRSDDETFELADDLSDKVKAKKIAKHLKKFDRIGAKNDDNRASGLPGYEASVDYVMKELRKAGYEPTKQAFRFPFFQEVTPSVLETTDGTTYETGAFTFSGAGDVTGTPEGVDLALDGDRASTSGCEATDFDGFTAGNIAILQRGACAFGLKAENAEAAGATAVVIFNQGNEPSREGLIVGTLGGPMTDPIPVVGASFADGVALTETSADVHVVTDTIAEERTTWNVLAETEGGDPDNIVMAGAHLDSVADGPGVNDNGSGSAAILEVAKQLAKETKHEEQPNKVRFAWWGAEELGLLGSEHYVADLQEHDPAALDQIAMYLNFDMVGSPNYVRFVYDGDNSRFDVGQGAAAGPKGSDAIEQAFHDAFADAGLASEETPFSGRSDYGPFIAEGVDIPAGGLFTGAEGTKTEEQAAVFGGEAGIAYDPCYHANCDTLDNVSMDAIEEMSGAIAQVTGMFAVSTEPVNGVGEPWPEGGHGQPVGSGTSGGGGLHAGDHEHPAR